MESHAFRLKLAESRALNRFALGESPRRVRLADAVKHSLVEVRQILVRFQG